MRTPPPGFLAPGDREALFCYDPPMQASFAIDPDGWADLSCPYCGEWLTIHFDPQSEGELVQDCEVCCRPWQLKIDRRRSDRPRVRVDVL